MEYIIQMWWGITIATIAADNTVAELTDEKNQTTI